MAEVDFKETTTTKSRSCQQNATGLGWTNVIHSSAKTGYIGIEYLSNTESLFILLHLQKKESREHANCSLHPLEPYILYTNQI